MKLRDFLSRAVRNCNAAQPTAQRQLIAVIWWTERPVPHYGTKARDRFQEIITALRN
jgi:hypothetical protein